MRESLGPSNPKGAMKVKACLDCSAQVRSRPAAGGRSTGPSRPSRQRSGRRSKSVPVGTRKMVNYA